MNRFTGKISLYLQEFWKYRDLLKLLVTKSVKLKYRRSVSRCKAPVERSYSRYVPTDDSSGLQCGDL